MHALKPGGVRIPRAFESHKTPDGYTYRVYVTAILARLGPLPAHADPTLREAGLCVVELGHLARELETAKARKRRRDIARARKAVFMLREQLQRLERRLEELGTQHRQAHPLAAVHRMVAEANRR